MRRILMTALSGVLSVQLHASPPDGIFSMEPCEREFFQGSSVDESATIIGLLEYGLRGGFLTPDELDIWAGEMRIGQSKSPFSGKSSSSGTLAARIWESRFSHLTELPRAVTEWLEELIQTEADRGEVDEETRTSVRRIQFVTIPFSQRKVHGSQSRIEHNQRVVGRSFEIMDTPMTDWMLYTLLGLGVQAGVQWRDLPAVHVTIETMVGLANSLSEGRVPISTAMAVIPDYRNGDRYIVPSTDVYRILALSVDGARNDGPLIDPLETLDEYEWTVENAHREIQPVAHRKPTRIAGQKLFDFFGNVQEVAIDKYLTEGVFFMMTPGSVFADRGLTVDRDRFSPQFTALNSGAPSLWETGGEHLGFRLLRVKRGRAR